MKSSIYLLLLLLFSCQTEEKKTESTQKENEEVVSTSKVQRSETEGKDDQNINQPMDGEYTFDIAYAEWQGKTMGDKVQVVVEGDKVKVIYLEGNLKDLKKGQVMEEGLLIKHKSGVWIIGSDASDAEKDEVGGCSGGPTIIDFEEMTYWMC